MTITKGTLALAVGAGFTVGMLAAGMVTARTGNRMNQAWALSPWRWVEMVIAAAVPFLCHAADKWTARRGK